MINIRLPYIPWMTGLATVVPVLMELTPLTCSSREVREVPNARLIAKEVRLLLTVFRVTPEHSPVILSPDKDILFEYSPF